MQLTPLVVFIRFEKTNYQSSDFHDFKASGFFHRGTRTLIDKARLGAVDINRPSSWPLVLRIKTTAEMTTHTSTKSQKALLFEKPLAPFTLRDIPKYVPGPGEILIKVHAVGLNPVDWRIQKSGLSNENVKFPAVLGLDIAGEVDETGEGVTEFQRGDRV